MACLWLQQPAASLAFLLLTFCVRCVGGEDPGPVLVCHNLPSAFLLYSPAEPPSYYFSIVYSTPSPIPSLRDGLPPLYDYLFYAIDVTTDACLGAWYRFHCYEHYNGTTGGPTYYRCHAPIMMPGFHSWVYLIIPFMVLPSSCRHTDRRRTCRRGDGGL